MHRSLALCSFCAVTCGQGVLLVEAVRSVLSHDRLLKYAWLQLLEEERGGNDSLNQGGKEGGDGKTEVSATG